MYRRYILGLFTATTFLFGSLGLAETCPTNLQYTNGNYLKRGDAYFFSNGNNLIRNNYIYYPNGNTLKRDNFVYYPNGNMLQRDSYLYYPNGNTLKRNADYYYANGNVLKRDTSFYYENGNVARRNGKLYRQDGTETAFPVTLAEKIDAYGTLFAEVRTASDVLDIDFRDLVVADTGTNLRAIWNGTTMSRFEISLNTGVTGEDVFVTVQNNTVSCSLGGTVIPGETFSLFGKAASVEVRVNPGYNPNQVRQALQNALNSIAP